MILFKLGDEIATTITSVNPRTEKHGQDDRVAAVDIGLHAKDVPASAVAILFGLDSEEGLAAAFWDSKGKVIAREVEWLPTTAKFEDGYDIHLGDRHERVDRVKKFKIKPTGGHTCEVTLQCQISEPSDGLIEHAVEEWAEGFVNVQLLPVPDLFDRLQSEAAEGDDEPEGLALEFES